MAFLAFYSHRRVVSNILDNAEYKYYQDKLHEQQKDYGRIFDICNDLLGCNKDLPFPPSNSEQELADQFNKFLTNKISEPNFVTSTKWHSPVNTTNRET